jgi:hypothetical protein
VVEDFAGLVWSADKAIGQYGPYNVVEVSAQGVVTPKAAGFTYVNVAVQSNTAVVAKCQVTVKAAEVVVEKLTLSPAEKKIDVGQMYSLEVTSEPDFSTLDDKTITFVSSNPEVATVSEDGLVKGISYGEAVITATAANGVSATTVVHVTDVTPTPDVDGVVKVLVDPEYLALRGELSGPYHVFSTIQQALDYLAHVDAATQKLLAIASGTYNEKLEITIPNLKIEGWGEKPEDVLIEWDSLYGLVDAGGFTHTTDSTATVAVRDSAVNVIMENITISNYWNTQERMDEAGLAIERGLALLVQSDRFVMKNSRLLGIQDTLELFMGRQYFEDTFISGYTDFIFGTNNTTYFKIIWY